MEQDIIHIQLAGMGVNTIAQLILLTEQGVKLDYILFSNTGGERKKTYHYIPIMNKWLQQHGQPKIITLRQLNRKREFVGLYNDVYERQSLPAIVFGFKTCSLKFKKGPCDVFINNNTDIQRRLKAGAIIHKHIGFDIDEAHRMNQNFDTDTIKNAYDLVEAEMGRFECEKMIREAGLPPVGKSSCFFCPSLKPWEIIELYETEPKVFYRAIALERNAKGMTAIEGLGRDFSWWDLIVAYRYLRFIKRNPTLVAMPLKFRKLIKKLNKSKPDDFEAIAKSRQAAKTLICDLFTVRVGESCDCMS